MATIKKLSRDMIENCLRSMEIKYSIDNDGDVCVTYDLSDDTDFDINELYVFISQEGEGNCILAIWSISDKKIPINLFAKSMLVCNTWNKEKRWPTAYLRYQEGEKEGTIILDNHISFEKGVHQELLCDHIHWMLLTSLEFWKWIKKNDHL